MKKSEYGFYWIYQKTRGVRLHLTIYTLLVLFVPVLQIAFSYFMKLFIDIATGNIDISLLSVVLRTVAVVATGGIVIMINAVLSKCIYGKLERNLRAELLDVIFTRRLIDISKLHTGELLTKLTVDVQSVSTCFLTMIDNIVGGAASALLATTALFFLNWKIAIMLLVLIPLLMFVMGAFTPRIQEASANDKQNDEINRSMIQENLSKIMLIKTYFMQGKTIEKINRTYESKQKSGMVLGAWEGLASFAGTLFGNVMSMVTLGFGAYFVLKGETTVGSLLMIVQLLNYIVTPVSKFSVAIAQISQAIASSDRIGSIYALSADRVLSAVTPINATELIAKGLCFSYGAGNESGDGSKLLDHVNMSFPKGKITGIVGKSGSGKTTLLKLLIGLYTPQAGVVELKHNAGIVSGEEIMPLVAYVPPLDSLFSGSVSDNIIMSEYEPRFEDMWAAATDANIIEFIQSLPQGFNTRIGESGSTVSSGQAQRIAIARAIYKKALIIVFDEPTTNLDIDSIEKFQSVIKFLAKNKICIIVTHDVSTITVCDKVYVLENGSVKETSALSPIPPEDMGHTSFSINPAANTPAGNK